jgi:hypothetical protein
VTEQIGGDHVVALGEYGHDGVPRSRTPGESVDEQNDVTLLTCASSPGRFGFARTSIPDRVTVDGHVLQRRPRTHAFSIAFRRGVDPVSAGLSGPEALRR